MINEEPNINNFTMLSVIGKGSYAKVVLVRKKGLNNTVYAMKILKKKYIEKKKQQANVMAEKQILAGLHHPFLIELHYSFQTQKKLFFVLEYCPGGELFRLLAKKQRLSEQQAKFYSTQIILALEYLHNQKIVYRDLKPQNVLIDKQGYIRLTDFGLSIKNIVEPSALSVCGTPQYLAPQILYKEGHGKPVDWWCLGSVIYEMVVGLPPFYSKNRQELFDKIKFGNPIIPSFMSLKLRDLLLKLFQKRPDNRIGSKQGAIEIKKHVWFENINWNEILNKKVKPPFIPIIKSEVDVSNFDQEFTECEIESPSENSPKSQEGKSYEGFGYNKSEERKMELQAEGDSIQMNIQKSQEK